MSAPEIDLSQLEAKFIRYERRADGEFFIDVETIDEAQGVEFLCPRCFTANNGPVGTHMVVCWSRSRGVPDEVEPRPGRWALAGTSIADLTLNADPPGTARSVQLNGGCSWHGFVTNGRAVGA